jgi:hypothetical protein
MFYVGEPASDQNGYIPNRASTWDEHWQEHYGGVDSPDRRSGWLPAGFTPKENPFYVALPYNDLDESGSRKASARQVYWSARAVPGKSLVKNTWIELCNGGKCAYGQWEDAGPYGEDDATYVFGAARPANKRDLKAGIDVSPAINDFLSTQGDAAVSWRFVTAAAVPDGPWSRIITAD